MALPSSICLCMTLVRLALETTKRYTGPKAKVTELAAPWQHVVVWTIGVILAALTPLLLPYFHGIDKNNTPSMYNLLGHGDLLLIALVITIAGITELMLVMRNIPFSTIMPVAMAILGGLLAIVAEAFWYSDLAVESLNGNNIFTPHVPAGFHPSPASHVRMLS
jgi:hypothetical protein